MKTKLLFVAALLATSGAAVAENGPARDAAYIAQQKASHGQALNLQKAYAMEGTAPALKSAASSIVPVVEHHIIMLMTV